jgi:hypothetical protein
MILAELSQCSGPLAIRCWATSAGSTDGQRQECAGPPPAGTPGWPGLYYLQIIWTGNLCIADGSSSLAALRRKMHATVGIDSPCFFCLLL